MVNESSPTSTFFIAGGALPPDAQCYVARLADDELLNAALTGQFGYVLAGHHLGKSSLMFRAAWRLQQQGISAATFDLSGLSLANESAYLLLAKRLKFELKLTIDPAAWWTDHAALAPGQRFINFLREVALAQFDQPLVIFVDGVNQAGLNRDFFADFSAAMLAVYQARATDPVYNRLTFVLFGMATPANLMTPGNQTLFSAGRQIELREFSLAEVRQLTPGLPAAPPDYQAALLNRIFYWTNGHPYLTQKLCAVAARQWNDHWTDADVDALVERVFISSGGSADPNLQFIEESLKFSARQRQLLELYRQIYQDKKVAVKERDPNQTHLQLVGLVQPENGMLKVRNEVYRQVFNQEWVKAGARATNKQLYQGIAAALMVLLLMAGLGFFIQQQRQRTLQAQAFIDNFRQAADPTEQLINLAGLFNVRGYQSEAQRLFFQELNPDDQLALFNQANPETVGEPLITVIKGLYTSPELAAEPSSTTLLKAMAQPLNQLQYSSYLGAIELELEITQWLKGRDAQQTQGQYQRAIDAYNVAINMNNRQPGTYFERGVAYASLGNFNQALADFATVLSLDSAWQPRVQQTLIDNNQLYAALWQNQSGNGVLIALVPTPTSTPIPTETPLPTPTPRPTDTPLPPTATPTNAPTATATPKPSPTPTVSVKPAATPTPSTPTGIITLLNPASIEETAHGVINFEWQWAGAIPPGFGFEVRVWQEGKTPAGVHNAVLDNQNGNIKNLGGDKYSLSVDIKDAAGVQGRSGVYLWSVSLVRISPAYADLGQQAKPVQFRFSAPGSPDKGGDGQTGGGAPAGGGGGGVGIE